MTKTGHQILSEVDRWIKKEFDSNRRILSFEEYLSLLAHHPEQQLRGSAQYAVEMMEFYGKEPVINHRYSQRDGIFRFKIFDHPVDGIAPKVVGQEEIQTEIYHALKSFARQRFNNRLLLLHGPNGSAKSTLVHALMGGLERYSHEDEGAVYTFTWIFPVERFVKGGMGIQSYSGSKDPLTSYAKLHDEDVAARIPCDMKDHPLLLIPKTHRREVLEELLGKEKVSELWKRMPTYLTEGDLSHRNKLIFEALLNAHEGDYKKVLMHIQVRRFFHSRRYRDGLVTIEPQMHVDAQYHQITMDKSIASLPASLQGLNLFSLTGDLVSGNRGVVEFSDMLKRPLDSFKYLLTACETGSVTVGAAITYLDTIMIGTANELQMDAFKEFPDFMSFKARFELIRVPYLLSVHQEQEIYDLLLEQSPSDKPVAPHIGWTLATWAVLTRLKKPNSINYPPNVSSLISSLTPLDKAKLYDTGEVPHHLSPEDRRLLLSHIQKLREEYSNIPYYEGRIGASAREMKSILFDAAHHTESECLSPFTILNELDAFVKRVSEHEFLRQDVKDGYHDAAGFIEVVRNLYLDKVDKEVRDCLGLYDHAQWESFIRKYIQNVAALLKKERIQNPITGKAQDPDLSLIEEFEQIVKAPKKESELDHFRNGAISRVGAWSLDHGGQAVVYSKVFPEYWSRIENHFYESQKSLLTKMHNALLLYDTEKFDPTSEGAKLAKQTLEAMKDRLGYTEACAKEVVMVLMKKRY